MGKLRSGHTVATTVLVAAGTPHALHTYVHDNRAGSFGQEAAAALKTDPQRIYKTLVVDTGDKLAVGVVPVTHSLDLRALATALNVKRVVMAEPAAAERSTGMIVGGISPLGQKRPLTTVCDDSMHRHATVLVSGGRRGLDVELAPADLARLTNAIFAPISRS